MMVGRIFERRWPHAEQQDRVEVCDGCHTTIWPTRWNGGASTGFDAFLARRGWHEYYDESADQSVSLCPECAAHALLRGEIQTLYDWRIHPVRPYVRVLPALDETVSGRLMIRASVERGVA